MPIVDLEPIPFGAPISRPEKFSVTPGEDEVNLGSDAPSFSQGLGAAFRQDNSTVNWLMRGPDIDTYGSPTIDLRERLKEAKREQDFDLYLDVFTEPEFRARYDQIEREREDRKTLAAMPWWQSLSAQMIAGTLDWPTALPGGVFVRGVHGGISVGRTALNTALMGGVATGAQEAALQTMQQTRTWEESAVNIGASVFLSGLLGGGLAGMLSKAEWDLAVKAVEADFAGLNRAVGDEPAGGVDGAPGSLGAAAVSPTDIEGNTIAGRAAGAVAAATARLNPALRLSQSPSALSREVANQLFENTLYLKKNFEGVASDAAVETLMKEWNSGLASALRATNDAYSEYRQGGGQLGRDGFRQAVGRAMRRLDEDENPVVAKVAKEWRSKVFDPLKQKAIEAGLLPEDVSVETAASYFSRMWDRGKLIAREPEFKNIVQEWVAQNAPGWAKQFDQATERKLNPLRREIEELEMSKLRRAEERRIRDEDGEIEAGEMSEADIRTAIRIVEGGAPRPKGVKTLTQFIHEQGGLVDFSGELAHMGINNRTRPGFVRKERDVFGRGGGGMGFDDAALRAWEAGYFPDHIERPTVHEFLEALADDFSKRRAVIRAEDRDAFRLTELIEQLEADLNRVGVVAGERPRFATSEEVKGMVKRVYDAMDAEADRKIAQLKRLLQERENARIDERESRFVGDPKELGRAIADEVFDTLTGKTQDGTRPEFIKIKARGPLKERTFNIPDALVEQFLESDVEKVGRRYTRIMGADVELAHRFGKPDMEDQLAKVREDYKRLRQGVTSEKELTRLGEAEKRDIKDLKALRDLLRGVPMDHPLEGNFNRISRAFNHINYIRSMGEVVLASVMDAMRPAMVHGLGQYMATAGQLATNLKGVKLSVREAQLAGNVSERVLGSRLATISEIIDPYASRGPVESFLENMTNVASKWNGIRIWTDSMKAIASVMTQDRILRGALNFEKISPKERAYLAYLGIDQSMAERIAAKFREHGEIVDGVHVANTEDWAGKGNRQSHAEATIGAQPQGRTADPSDREIGRDALPVQEQATTPAERVKALEPDLVATYNKELPSIKDQYYKFASDKHQYNEIDAKAADDMFGPKEDGDWPPELQAIIEKHGRAVEIVDGQDAKPEWFAPDAAPTREQFMRDAVEAEGGLLPARDLDDVMRGLETRTEGAETAASYAFAHLAESMGWQLARKSDRGGRYFEIERVGPDGDAVILNVRISDHGQLTKSNPNAVTPDINLAPGAHDFADAAEVMRAAVADVEAPAPRLASAVGQPVPAGPDELNDAADRAVVRAYRAAINKDVDSIIVTKSVADVPLFASTPTGRAMLQFKTFALASHQRVLLRGLQEDQARFVGGLIAMTALGMFVTWAKSISGNREDRLVTFAENPGWWIGEGLDRSGVMSVPMELANVFEKASGLNPIKSPFRAFDEKGAMSQKLQNRSFAGSLAGPTAGLFDDLGAVAGIPRTMLDPDKDVTQGQKNAAERLMPFNSYLGMRQMLRYLVNERDPD